MTKADLHVHSKYSEHPSEWFLQRLGAGESYTEPEQIYRIAKESGMDFVTITDHNRIDGALLLQDKYPTEVFTGVESTAYFPEDGCKVHLLIYGLTEKQYKTIEKIRTDIYTLREFIKEEDLAYSVAHATFSVNGKISMEHLEKLILLFDIFEGINGGRNKINNLTWMKVLKNLTPLHIGDLYSKYKIEPFSETPWIKGFTAGSDDHAGIFIGETYTLSEANSVDEFLAELKRKHTYPLGKHNDYDIFAFIIYKIATDFLKTKSDADSNSLLNRMSEMIFENNNLGFRDKRKFKNAKIFAKNGNPTQKVLLDTVEKLKNSSSVPLKDKLDMLYETISNLSDEILRDFIQNIIDNINKGNILNLFKNISSFLPSVFLSVPFFSSLKHMHSTRNLIDALQERYLKNGGNYKKKILWLTDTINDMNGVSVTLKEIGHVAYNTKRDVVIGSSLLDSEITNDLPPKFLNIPYVYHFNLPYYEKYILKIPSMLKSLKIINELSPDVIFVSTPGPIGLLGLLLARLLNVKCVGVYHTDFNAEAAEIVDDESIINLLGNYMRWFYSNMNEIYVPTIEYMDILESRGYDRSKMKILRRGIDSTLFHPSTTGRSFLEEKYNVKKGINLLFAGRVSKDKNLDFLADVYRGVLERREDINLLIAGDGPYLKQFKEKMKEFDRAYFLGRVDREILPEIYTGSDLFIFPSTTDTFGMVVLEAQACGLPAIVSDVGGPKEIIIERETGYIVPVDSITEWIRKVDWYIENILPNSESVISIRGASSQNALMGSDWDSVLRDLLDEDIYIEKESTNIRPKAIGNKSTVLPIYE